MTRYRAPVDTTAIYLPNETLTVDADGFVEAGDHLTYDDHAALARNGFVLEPVAVKAKAQPTETKD